MLCIHDGGPITQHTGSELRAGGGGEVSGGDERLSDTEGSVAHAVN